LDIPLIVDAKHGDLNSSSALASYLFRNLGADAVTLSPLSGQDIAAPFLLYPEKAVVVTCHSSNPASRVLQHFPSEDNPLYLRIVREAQLWATPEQLLLEVGTSDPAILQRVRREAPERFLILRSLWAEEDRLDALLEAGLTPDADGLLLPLPQNLLVEDDIAERANRLKRRISDRRERWLEASQLTRRDSCTLWLPGQAAAPGASDTGASGRGTSGAGTSGTSTSGAGSNDADSSGGDSRGAAGTAAATVGTSGTAAAPGSGADPSPSSRSELESDPLAALIIDLFDIGCLLFGEYVQACGEVFKYYIDLRQIISDPNLFHRVLHSYAEKLEGLEFERIAGIPYGSLPTATGLSLQLHKPLIYPRKEVKAHGARRLIEGDFEEGDRVAVVDDILISGGSVLEGIAKLESSGLVVRDVVVFLDHGGDKVQVEDRGGRRRLELAGYRCHAVVDIARITAVLHRAGRLTAGQARMLGPASS
jgi:uridine monophosphate synthetase